MIELALRLKFLLGTLAIESKVLRLEAPCQGTLSTLAYTFFQYTSIQLYAI